MLRALQWERTPEIPVQLRWLAKRAARPVLMLAMMFLLMWAELPMRASPLAPALLAAALAAGENGLMPVLGCLLGTLRIPLTEISLLPATACAIVLVMELLASLLPFLKKTGDETRISLSAGLAVLIPALVDAGGEVHASLLSAACAALAAVAAPFFLAALKLHMRRKRLLLQEKAALVLLGGACLAGMYHWIPDAAEVISSLLVLIIPGAGASTGIFCGIALIAGGASTLQLGGLALCALVSSWKWLSGRWQRALGVCIAVLLYRLAAGEGAPGTTHTLAAALIYMVLPPSLMQRLHAMLQGGETICNPDRIAREVTMESQRRLRALGDAFSEMAQSCTAPADVPDEQELICEMRSRLCSGCPGYGECWNGGSNHAVRFLCRLITDALDRVDAPPGMRVLFSDGEIPPDVLRACRRGRMIPDRLGLLLRDFAEKRRSEIKRCTTGQLLSQQLIQAREILYDLAQKQAAPLSFRGKKMEQLTAALDGAGLSHCEAAAIGMDFAQVRLTRDAEGWTRDEVRRACAALSRAFGGGFRPDLQGNALLFSQHARFRVDTGVSCQSGMAGQACGDSHMIRMLGPGKLAILLSDGMGCGEAAYEQSRETLHLLWKFLDAGISRPLALETVNQQMLMRSSEDIFSTVDLCTIDLNTGIAEFSKLAASRTLILRGSEVLHIEGGHLPLGILEKVQPAVTRIRLRPGDTIVMGSDGVMEAGDGMMMDRIARRNGDAPPEALAEELVREAGLRRSRGHSDDLTCICARLMEEKRQRAG